MGIIITVVVVVRVEDDARTTIHGWDGWMDGWIGWTLSQERV